MDALRERAPRALHVAELCKRIGVAKSRRDEVLDVLDALNSLGLVTEMPGNRYRAKRQPKQLAASRAGVTAGVLQLTTRGFGFVAADDGDGDVFIPATAVGPALHGDRVEISARPSPKGREGDVIGILERRPARITGTLARFGKTLVIEPDDDRLRGPIHVVGDLPERRVEGLAVVAEIEKFPQGATDLPTASVVQLLGVQGMTSVEVTKIKIRENVIEEFDDAVVSEASTLPEKIRAEDFLPGRDDLREVDLVTIDPETARDHDDAIFCERDGSGYHVIVAIADVSHYVTPGTALDRAALERGCSIYLPDRAIPMLPPELSSNLASLVADEDRLCVGVEAWLHENGTVRKHRLFEGVMRCQAGLTYRGVADALGLTTKGSHQPAARARRENLQALLELSRKTRKRRMRRGSLDFDLPEPRVQLDAHGVEPIDVRRSKEDPGIRDAYRMVEEMMLLTNELVAMEMKKRQVPAVYRAHGKPDEKKIMLFAQLAEALGFDINAESATNPKQLAKFLRRIEGRDEAPILRFLLLRAMQQAVYDINGDIGHFGLGTKDYLHFTSPIRRYPDLIVHRVVRQVIQEKSIDAVALLPRLRRAAAESSRLERRAMVVERDVVALYRTILMRERVGEEFEGTITTIDHYGFRVAFDEPFVEAMVPVDKLQDYFETDDLGIRLIGQRTGTTYALGDRIQVRLEGVAIAKRELTALPVGEVARVDKARDGRQPPRRKRDPKGRKAREARRQQNAKRREEKRGKKRAAKKASRRRKR
ncbi:MAG: VacB/RNase II family 3'-5' exoribonuclease [Myxococcota bacterium]